MKKAKKIIDKLLLTLAGIALFVMVILSVYQVATRFILNSPSTMSEEIVRFLLIWFAQCQLCIWCKTTYSHFIYSRKIS